MKRFIWIFLCLDLAGTLQAQTPYPSAPPASANITRIEYYIDTDPGLGNGTPLTITPQTNINNLVTAIDLSALSKGFHQIIFRAQDANGLWSFWLNNFFSNVVVPVYPSAPAVSANIIRIEYFLDANPVPGTGIDVPVAPGTDVTATNVVVDISALSKSAHTLYIAAKDANGTWSLTNLVVFSNASISAYPSAPAAATNLQQLEYFIDNDPGPGNGTAVPITPSTDIANFSVNVDLTGLSDGTHYFFIRSRNNPWSLTNVVSFQKGAGLPVRWLYVRGEWKDQKALLQWATSFEQHTSHFDIEQSVDGQQYRKIGTVAAAGNSNVIRIYQFTDDKAGTGWNYYRIRQVDLDGKSDYSRVITLLNKTNLKTPLLYPNPASQQVYIELPASGNWESVSIYNSNGQLEKSQALQSGQTLITLDVQALSTGLHTIELKSSGQKKPLRFLKN